MKLEINVDMNDRNLEYTQWPTWFLEEPPESTVVINIRNNPWTEDLDYQVYERAKNIKVEEIKNWNKILGYTAENK